MSNPYNTVTQELLDEVIKSARKKISGKVAEYIPELACVPKDILSGCVMLVDGSKFCSGDELERRYTLQSISKLIVLIGLLEELGDQVFEWVRVEPSGADFSSVARLDQFGPISANPMLNDGAITLCNYIPGNSEERFAWIRRWCNTLFASELPPNMSVFASERRCGDRNRSLAYLLKSNGILTQSAEMVLESYFYLCSCEASIKQIAYLPFLLANGGLDTQGNTIISKKTVRYVLAIMATCGLYNESGAFYLEVGMPGKSSVSGILIATSFGKAGIAAVNPCVNRKGNSQAALEVIKLLSNQLGYHFAS